MASANTGNSRKRKTSSKPASTRNRKKTASKVNQGLKDEIFLLVTIAVAVILLLSCFNFAGEFGEGINSFMFGLFGMVEYIFPIVAVVGAFFLVANKRAAIVRVKLFITFFMLMFISAFIQKLSKEPDIADSLLDFYSYSSMNRTGGGLIGGIICKILNIFGTAGTFVILLLLIVICLLFITEGSIITGLKSGSKRALNSAKDDYRAYKDYADERRIQRQMDEAMLEEEYYRQQEVRKKKREQRIEEIRRKEEEKANRKRRTDNKVVGTNINNDMGGYEPVMIAPGDLTEVTLDFTEEPSLFNIEDEYTKDIYDVNKTVEKKKNTRSNDVQEVFVSEPEHIEEVVKPEVIEKPLVNTVEKISEPVVEEVNADIMPKKKEETPKTSNLEKVVKASAYKKPPLDLLVKGNSSSNSDAERENKQTALKLQQTLANFGVRVSITDISCGPSVTRYELLPEQGTKVAKIVSLSDDIKMNLAATDIRIEAPIPGKAAIGIEVPNKEAVGVTLRELLESTEFKNNKSKISFAAGKDIAGKVIVTDIGKMPHLLIAGATGSGKSVCINTIIMSILYNATPDEVKLILIDPKVVELSVYNGIPHLLIPVVTDPKKASGALNWAVAEMTDRYNKFAAEAVRDMKGYNEKMATKPLAEGEVRPNPMPQIVIIIDELADLMMVASKEVEESICRLAQLARAAGIHLIIATQRPSVNVITGLIKANVPSRIAFSVSSGVDSRTILDMNGAEKLLGKGDMLFFPQGLTKPSRVQGAFVSDKEVSAVVEFLKEHSGVVTYDDIITNSVSEGVSSGAVAGGNDDRDEYFAEAGRFIIEKEKASIGMLQRYYKVGFNRAARIMDQLSDAGLVGPEEGTKPRKILMTMEEFEEYLKNN